MFKVKYKYRNKEGVSPKSFRTKANAQKAVTAMVRLKKLAKKGIVQNHYLRYSNYRIVKLKK